MAIFLVNNAAGKTAYKTKNLIVAAETAADAKAFAKSHFNGDAAWDDATTTAIAAGTLDDSAAMLGWRFVINVSGAAGLSAEAEVEVTGAGTDDLDAVAAKLVTALNATADIANAAYSAPNLTVATGSGGDDLGDGTVIVKVFPPSGDTGVDLSGILVASITDEGVSTDALTVALVADTETLPKVLAEVEL